MKHRPTDPFNRELLLRYGWWNTDPQTPSIENYYWDMDDKHRPTDPFNRELLQRYDDNWEAKHTFTGEVGRHFVKSQCAEGGGRRGVHMCTRHSHNIKDHLSYKTPFLLGGWREREREEREKGKCSPLGSSLLSHLHGMLIKIPAMLTN